MSQPSWIGRSLNGRYQIETLLGQGGMSAVYKATDPNLKRTVAIKLIHSHLATDKHFIDRFEEEATAVASLRHPNIVQVYDFNSDAGTYYMVLEYVEGETLQDRLKHLNEEGRLLPINEAIKYILNICDALGYAHKRGMIHRDIKPANIMLDMNGQAILMDFGIVKILGGTSHTATGSVLGTARYISPEVIRSEPADQRSDIYSLGVMMYEVLSGQPPFQSDSTMSLLMMHLNDPVPDPRKLRAEIPAPLVNILLKCLEKDRNNRYQNVGELAQDLNSVLVGLSNGTIRQAKRNPVVGMPQPQTPLPTILEPMRTPGETGTSSVYPTIATGAQTPPPKRDPMVLLMGGVGAGFALLVILAVVITAVYMSSHHLEIVPVRARPTIEKVPTVVQSGSDLTPTIVPAATAALEQTSPTVMPQITDTLPVYYVRINSISIIGNRFVVQYETFGFVEKLPFMHIHFFFNNVAPEDAGVPGAGPWIMYGGPRPFKGYTVSQRPEGVTQLCALVAYSNHTVIKGSGNCKDLP